MGGVLLLLLISCKKSFSDTEQPKANSLEPITIAGGGGGSDGIIALGAQLINPYTLPKMTQAYDQLTARGITSGRPVNIRATHYYVKFKPSNWYQLNKLEEDSTLILFPIPIDYAIAQEGNRYHDPAVADTLPTYQYASVPGNYTFIDTIPYEVISSLYIPEEDASLLGAENVNEPYVDKLLDEAYKLTNNFRDTLQIEPTTGQQRAGYNPSGKIQIFDTRLQNTIGMHGVQVRARRWFTVYTTHTDFSGNYYINKTFKRDCNYSIWFYRARFVVREHVFGGAAWINGPKQSGPWNYTIQDGFDRFSGHVFRDAYRFHYGNVGGLTRPNQTLPNIYVAVNGDRSVAINWIFVPIIKVWRYESGKMEYDSDEIFSTTCHETAHTTHRLLMGFTNVSFWSVTKQLRESWAIGVEWYITGLEYRDTRGIPNYGAWNYHVEGLQYPNDYGYQYWYLTQNGVRNDYSSLYINLLDNFNELGVNFVGYNTGLVNDPVNAYPIVVLEQQVVSASYGLSSLAQNLKNNLPIWVTAAQIDELLSFY